MSSEEEKKNNSAKKLWDLRFMLTKSTKKGNEEGKSEPGSSGDMSMQVFNEEHVLTDEACASGPVDDVDKDKDQILKNPSADQQYPPSKAVTKVGSEGTRTLSDVASLPEGEYISERATPSKENISGRATPPNDQKNVFSRPASMENIKSPGTLSEISTLPDGETFPIAIISPASADDRFTTNTSDREKLVFTFPDPSFIPPLSGASDSYTDVSTPSHLGAQKEVHAEATASSSSDAGYLLIAESSTGIPRNILQGRKNIVVDVHIPVHFSEETTSNETPRQSTPTMARSTNEGVEENRTTENTSSRNKSSCYLTYMFRNLIQVSIVIFFALSWLFDLPNSPNNARQLDYNRRIKNTMIK